MLRYKNSLLERILLEKGGHICSANSYLHSIDTCSGIDVQAELQAKTGSPGLQPNTVPHAAAAAPTIQPALQRTAMNRQYARRSMGTNAPVMPANASTHINHENAFAPHGPHGQPTPPSHASSPNTMSAKSPSIVSHSRQHRVHQQPHLRPQPDPQAALPRPPSGPHPGLNGSSGISTSSQTGMFQGSAASQAAAYYPSPFQKHMDQLGKFFLPTPFLIELCSS